MAGAAEPGTQEIAMCGMGSVESGCFGAECTGLYQLCAVTTGGQR